MMWLTPRNLLPPRSDSPSSRRSGRNPLGKQVKDAVEPTVRYTGQTNWKRWSRQTIRLRARRKGRAPDPNHNQAKRRTMTLQSLIRTSAVIAVGALTTWITSAQQAKNVDTTALRNAAKNGEEWLTHGHDYAET